MRAVEALGPHHPVERSLLILRLWLAMLVVMMTWNGVVANGILLEGWMRPLPWFFLAGMAMAWATWPWYGVVVIASSSVLTVGSMLRAMEVLLFADQYSPRGRLTGLSIYMTIAGTSLLVGVLNLVVTSKKTAEEWVWERSSNQPS